MITYTEFLNFCNNLKEDILVGILTSPSKKTQYQVMFKSSYGVTINYLCTTNGSILDSYQVIVEYLTEHKYTWSSEYIDFNVNS